MAQLTREQILGAPDIKRVQMDVPEWGGEVHIAALTAADRDAFEAHLQRKREGQPEPPTLAVLAALALCNAKGDRIFTAADASELGKKSDAAIVRVTDRALELGGMGKAAIDNLEKA